MVMRGEPGCLAQMVEVYNQTGGNLLGVSECDPAETHQYGIVGIGAELEGPAFRINGMVEKPKPQDAPSNLYINGRYILQPQIFDLLSKQSKGAGNEIQLTDAMLRLMDRQYFYGCRFDGQVYDCGSKVGFLTANVAFALGRKDIAEEFRPALEALLAGK